MVDDRKPKEPAVAGRRPMSERGGDLGRTVRMSSAPRPAGRLQTVTEIPAAMPRAFSKNVELLVVDETQVPGGERKPWRAAEVWTKRRVYALDSTFTCIEILDRESGRLEPGHDMLGARLGGGRVREGDAVRFSYPLALPGMEAMFMKGNQHGYTSPVERMIVRIRVLHTSADEVVPSWDEIANPSSEPPGG